MTSMMRDVCRMLDMIAVSGDRLEQELATDLLHEITDFYGRAKNWEGSTRESQSIPSATSTSMSAFQKTK
jgi:hypothetical protein